MVLFPKSALLVPALVLAACQGGPVVHGSGQIASEQRALGDFHAIDAGSIGEIYVIQDGGTGLTIEADDNLLPFIRSVVAGDVLHLDLEPGNYHPSQTPRLELRCGELTRIDLSGAVHMNAAELVGDQMSIHTEGASHLELGSLQARALDVEAEGAAQVRAEAIRAGSLTADTSGAGRVIANGGSLGHLRADCSGAAQVNMTAVQVQDAHVFLSGASQAWLWVEGALQADASGAAHVRYKGSPRLDVHSSGAASVVDLGRECE
ncbi:MAG: DUF2807 domain-containing protein [Planctomycetota bacterium]